MTSSAHSSPSAASTAPRYQLPPKKIRLHVDKEGCFSPSHDEIIGDKTVLLATHCSPVSLRCTCPRQPPTFRGFSLVEPTKRGGPESTRYHIWNWRRSLIGGFWWTKASTSDISATNGIFCPLLQLLILHILFIFRCLTRLLFTIEQSWTENTIELFLQQRSIHTPPKIQAEF